MHPIAPLRIPIISVCGALHTDDTRKQLHFLSLVPNEVAKILKILDSFFMVTLIYCINCRLVVEAVFLKSQRAEFWVNGLIPQFFYRQGIFY